MGGANSAKAAFRNVSHIAIGVRGMDVLAFYRQVLDLSVSVDQEEVFSETVRRWAGYLRWSSGDYEPCIMLDGQLARARLCDCSST